jgi:hypothetical protein
VDKPKVCKKRASTSARKFSLHCQPILKLLLRGLLLLLIISMDTANLSICGSNSWCFLALEAIDVGALTSASEQLSLASTANRGGLVGGGEP